MNVVIGIPTPPDNMANANTIAIAQAWSQTDNVSLICEPSPSPEEGRDKIVAKAEYMVPRPTHILFLDADVVPRKNTLRVLMQHDKDIITGVVPIFQQYEFRWNVCREDVYKPLRPDELPNNPFKVGLCGFGVVLVKMEVFEKMEWPYWRSEYQPGLRTVGEDIYFCQKARHTGFDIWCDPKVKCNHLTRANYLNIMKGLYK